MIIRYKILWSLPSVAHHLVGKEVNRDVLLHKKVAAVLLVCKHVRNGRGVPRGTTAGRRHALSHEAARYEAGAEAVEIIPIYAADEVGLFGHDDHRAGRAVSRVSEERGVLQSATTFLKPVFNAHANVCTYRRGLLLRNARQNRNENLSGRVHRIDGLLFEDDGNAERLELAYVREAINRVSGEARDRLCYNEVDTAGLALRDESHELGSALGLRAGDALVGKDAGQLPLGILGDSARIMRTLRRVAGLLLVARGTHATVCRHAFTPRATIG